MTSPEGRPEGMAAPAPGAGVCEDCRRPFDGPEGCSAHERNADAYGWVDDCHRATIILLRAEIAGLLEKLKQAERRGEEERAKALADTGSAEALWIQRASSWLMALRRGDTEEVIQRIEGCL